MRIIASMDYFPLPVLGGGRKRSTAVLRTLCNLAEVILTLPAPDRRHLEMAASDLGASMAFDSRTVSISHINRYLCPDLVHFETIGAAFTQSSKIGNTPFTMDCHNIEWQRDKQLSELGIWHPEKWDFVQQREEEIWRRSVGLLVCSRLDKAYIETKTNAPVVYAPNTITVAEWSADRAAERLSRLQQGSLRFLFTGQLQYGPNIDAIHWLIREIWPGLRNLHSNAKLVIAGVAPDEDIKALCRASNVDLHANVDDVDMNSLFWEADVYIVPLRAGGGTSFKVLEACSFGLPVITTTIGARDLTELHEMLVVADTLDEIVKGAAAIAGDPSSALDRARLARKVVVDKYGPSMLQRSVESFLEIVTEKLGITK